MTLDKLHIKFFRHSTSISMEEIFKSLIKKRLTVKSKDCRVDLLRANASNLYNYTGKHFDLNRLRTTSSDAIIGEHLKD